MRRDARKSSLPVIDHQQSTTQPHKMEGDFGLIYCILVLLLILFGTIVALLIYSGLFFGVEIRAGRPPFQSIVIAYKYARGPYRNAGSLFTELTCLVPQLKCIGIYYDDPSDVAPNDLRYAVGAILSAGEEVSGEQEKCRDVLVDNGFKLAKLPAVNHAVKTTFPFKNTLSIFLAVAKVYPQMASYIKERKLCAHPMIEVYDEGVIHFVAPLAKQNEFYVSEATEDQSDDEHRPSKHDDGNETSSSSNKKRSSIKRTANDRGDAADANGASDDGAITLQHEGSNGSGGEESAGSSFEELAAEAEK